MTLYLSPDLTPDEIRKAKQAGIVGVPLQMYLYHVPASDHMLQVSSPIRRV
jgi:dihydroorotase